MYVYVLDLKFFSAASLSWDWDLALRSRSQTYIFHTNVKVFAYIIKTLIDFSSNFNGDSYRSKVLFNMIHAPVPYL